jgi:hypothetical protein
LNNIPNDSELPIVRQLLADAIYNLDVVDEMISLVQNIHELFVQTLHDHDLLDEIEIPRLRSSTPATLLILRDTRRARVAKYRAALAPHKKVPPELLVKIFLYACEDRSLSLPPHNRTRPWVISQVCARWRQVALNEPRLWGDLSVTTDRVLSDSYPIKMRDIFARSAGMRISLKIDSIRSTYQTERLSSVIIGQQRRLGSAYPGAALEAATITDIILPHLALFRHLDLTFPALYFLPFFACSSGLIDSLESVRLNLEGLSWDNSDPFAEDNEPMTVFTGARSLRKVEIRLCRDYGRWYLLTWDVLDLPWAQLTFLCIGPGVAVTVSLAHDILQNSPQLVDCMMQLSYPDDAWDVDLPVSLEPTPIICPNLTSFDIFFKDGPTVAELVRPLVLPSLTHLKYTREGGLRCDQPDLTTLIQRSTCSITSIKMTSLRVIERVHEKFLEELPFVVEMEVPCLIFTPPILERISRRKLVPRLEILYCHVDSPGAFVDMLENRAPGLNIDPRAEYPRSGFWIARAECKCDDSASRSFYATAYHRLGKLPKVDGEALSLWIER